MKIPVMIGLLLVGGLTAVAVQAEDDPVALGADLAAKHKCSMCHQIDGKGGKMSQPLNGLAEGKTDEYLRGSLLDPKGTIDPKTKMPSYEKKLTAEEVDALIAYMKSLN